MRTCERLYQSILSLPQFSFNHSQFSCKERKRERLRTVSKSVNPKLVVIKWARKVENVTLRSRGFHCGGCEGLEGVSVRSDESVDVLQSERDIGVANWRHLRSNFALCFLWLGRCCRERKEGLCLALKHSMMLWIWFCLEREKSDFIISKSLKTCLF